ncbi:hypothetical protein AC578_9456 [Pseudocercospora eumusae]|uniref:Uncharacterized protein n=1 Tax=Pseudocercospora eumusae TaxID=321146 RepID=A0A139GYN0_9PEZI|nr:hypothetical protein AC578_9456 [Pseudocercospora eumusae]
MAQLIANFWQLAIIGLLGLVGYYVYLGIYNLFFHPLAKYPGPKLAALSEAWFVKSSLSGHLPYIFTETHKQYGDIVRISPNELSFARPEAVKEIYYNPTKTKPGMPKSLSYARPDTPHLFSVRDIAEHQKQKAAFTHAFSPRALKEQEPIVLQYTDAWISMLAREGTGPHGIDIVKAWNWLTFDIIGDLTFGASFDCVKTATTHPWIDMLFDSLTFGIMYDMIRRIPILKFGLPFVVPIKKLKQNRVEIREYTRQRVAARVETGTKRDTEDFFSDILSKGQYTEEGLISQAFMLIIAGSETSASALSGATFYLSHYPQALKRLQEEVRGAFTSSDQIVGDSTAPAKLPFLHACIEEALRLFPPAPSHALRVSPGATIDGQYIPAGVCVTSQNYPMSRDSRYFNVPAEYHPERWLKGDDCPPDFRDDNKAASTPFSIGPRSCIGVNLAYLEMRIALAKFVWHFDWELLPESKEWTKGMKTYFIWKKPAMMVRLKLREGVKV